MANRSRCRKSGCVCTVSMILLRRSPSRMFQVHILTRFSNHRGLGFGRRRGLGSALFGLWLDVLVHVKEIAWIVLPLHVDQPLVVALVVGLNPALIVF